MQATSRCSRAEAQAGTGQSRRWSETSSKSMLEQRRLDLRCPGGQASAWPPSSEASLHVLLNGNLQATYRLPMPAFEGARVADKL